MPESSITFLKGDDIGDDTDYRDNLPVNMTAIQKPLFNAQGYMIQAPGLSVVSTFGGSNPCTGAIWNERQDKQYRVFGGVVWEAVYTLEPDDEYSIEFDLIGFWTGERVRPSAMPYSFVTQGIVGGDNFHIWDPDTETFYSGGDNMDTLFVGTIDAVWIRGYYFLTDGDSLYHTLLSDEKIVEASENTAQLSPDPILGLGLTQDDKVIVFGRYTVEYFTVVAQAGFTFVNLPNRAFKSGIIATGAKVEIAGEWFYVGGRKGESIGVHMIKGIQPHRVSTREIEKVLAQYDEGDLDNMYMETREEGANLFLIIHLPNEVLQMNVTIQKTIGSMGAWSYLSTGTSGAPWRAIYGLYDGKIGGWIYGDKEDSRIGKLDHSVSTQYSEIVAWELFTPFMYLDSVSIDELQIETVPGHTPYDGATVFLSLSNNGVTQSKEVMLDYGGKNDYNKRLTAYRLGYVRNWFAIKLRGASRSRMAFARGKIIYG